MNPEKLTHLIYASAAAAEIDSTDLDAILQIARTNNAQRSVTGMLLYISGSFFQVLEGEESTLLELFAIIGADPRHVNVTQIILEPIAQRDFADWTMGFSTLDRADLAGVEGLSDFFQAGNSLTNLEAGRAKKLLAAFAQGRWRTRLANSAR